MMDTTHHSHTETWTPRTFPSAPLRWLASFFAGRRTTPHDAAAHADHRPRHVRMAYALDELERARLLQGGLR